MTVKLMVKARKSEITKEGEINKEGGGEKKMTFPTHGRCCKRKKNIA